MKKNPQEKTGGSAEERTPDLDLEQYDLAMGGSGVDEESPATKGDQPNIKKLIEKGNDRKTPVKRGFIERKDGSFGFEK